MNVTELARRLKIPSRELLEILPAVGFDIGRRAIKIDDRQAQRIVEQWPQLLAAYKEKIGGDQEAEVTDQAADLPTKKTITIPAQVRVKEFAEKMHLPLPKVMAELMKNGVLSSMNEMIDFDTAAIVGAELGFEVTQETATDDTKEKEVSKKLEEKLSASTKRVGRAPVVVVMGHVDHGKTKLLDAIRQTHVVEGESGGITQHIGAYQVVKNNKPITFIDTPGHEAFTTMRSRGARVADIAILVIAADDSIQPQTKESIKIIKSAGLPMMVAINKIDKPEANIDKVKQDLAALNLIPEDWGGKTITVPISAKQGTGIDELLDMILLLAETEKDEIVADPNVLAVGTIVDSHVDKGQGPVATLLVQNGTLHIGDHIAVGGSYYGKVRAMKDYLNKDVKAAPPSMPVKILGLKAAPSVGDILEAGASVDRKDKVSKYRLTEAATAYTKPHETGNTQTGQQQLNVVIKADVLGSLEAIMSSFVQLEHPEVSVNVSAEGLGNVTEGDVRRAEAGKAIIFAFHVKVTAEADSALREKKIEVKRYDVIYHLLEDVKDRLQAMLRPDVTRLDLGRLKVLAVFRSERDSMIVGGSVTKGVVKAGVKVDVLRGKQKITTCTITGLQQNKILVKELEQGKEGGVSYEGKPVIEEGDTLEAYVEEVKEKKL